MLEKLDELSNNKDYAGIIDVDALTTALSM
jgi:hypothetical protein